MSEPLQYIRDPNIPLDEEGARKYIATEFDKISFLISNLGVDNIQGLVETLADIEARLSALEGP